MADEPPKDEVRGVGKRARKGLKWTLIGTAGANAVRIISFPILGRLLTKAEFGAVGEALTVILFGQMLRDIGLGAALVQTQTLSKEQTECASGFSILLGLVLALVVFLGAPVAAWFYHTADLVPMIRALAAMFAFRAIGTVPRALLQRRMQFRAIAVIDFGSYFLGSVVSVALAFAGSGVWALILGYLVETGSATLAQYVLAPVGIRFGVAPIRHLFAFGAGSALADISVYFANNGDYLVTGRVLGKEPLGLYTRAYELMRFPATVFTNVAGGVLFSALARIQNDRERLGRAFRRGLFATCALLLPASAGLIIVAPEMIHVLLGNQWGSAVLPFQILSCSMMARASWKIGGTLARAAGDVYPVAVANVAYGVLIVAGALIGSHWGIVGVSVAVSIECTLHYLVYSWLGLRRTNLSWRDFAVVHLEALFASGIALAAVWAVAYALRSVGALDILVVAAAIVAGVLSLALAAFIGVRRGQPDWTWAWAAVRDRFRTAGARSGPRTERSHDPS